MNITVRRAVPEDAHEISLLEGRLFSDPWSERSLAEHLSSPHSRSLVGCVHEKVVGYCLFTALLPEGELLRIATDTEYRRSGVARMLLAHALSDGALASVYLEVRQGNAPAIALYRSLGFKAYGTRKNYYKNPVDDACLMSRHTAAT